MWVARLLSLATLAIASSQLRRDVAGHLQTDTQAVEQQVESRAMQLFNFAKAYPMPQLAFMQEHLTGEQGQVHPLTYVIQILAHVAMVGAFAYFYLEYRTVPAVDPAKSSLEEEDMQDWKHGCCSWYQTPGICCMACCCPSIRWSETISMVKGLMPFWTAFFIVLLLNKIVDLRIMLIFFWSFLMILYTSYRQRIRETFNFKNQGGLTYITDFLLYAFCYPCAITQEARHVEEAIERGHQGTQLPEGRTVPVESK
jgi:Cys-rich protein (TIGR01571 family)